MTIRIDEKRELALPVVPSEPQDGRCGKIVDRFFEGVAITADLRGVTANTLSAVPMTAPISLALAGLTVAGGALVLLVGPRILYAALKTKNVALGVLGAAFTALGGVITKLGVDKIHQVASPGPLLAAFTALGFLVYGIITFMATVNLYKAIKSEDNKEILKQSLLLVIGLLGLGAMIASSCGAAPLIAAILFALSSAIFLATDSSFILQRLQNLVERKKPLLLEDLASA